MVSFTFCETQVFEIQTRDIGTLPALKKASLGNKKMKRKEQSKKWASGVFSQALFFSFLLNLYMYVLDQSHLQWHRRKILFY